VENESYKQVDQAPLPSMVGGAIQIGGVWPATAQHVDNPVSACINTIFFLVSGAAHV